MGKAVISDGQARGLIGSFVLDTPWAQGIGVDIQPFLELPPVERGKRFAAFLRNGCRSTVTDSRTVLIDRSKPFDPSAIMGRGWRIKEEDRRSLALTEFDITKILLQSGINDGETGVTGEERRNRLIPKAIQLDAKVAQTLLEEECQLKLRFIHDLFGADWIEFLGTVLISPRGDEYSFDISRKCKDGSWSWGRNWLCIEQSAYSSAAGLAIK